METLNLVPSTLVNDVRNSLLAIRLLLFTTTCDAGENSSLHLAQAELLRLEALFQDLSYLDSNRGK
ncbi:hypothetical protein [Sulfoacidibacillus thermotolerans]|uniref:Uncharacterized protein n=1 Tax=Sulfoacidibacillus thermotolerans TaxID=1765684 RepID=A0A2U3D7H7_SULT2|nr:hypothetical protein [Sulfoacidibacillus thermotolerans]PWI57229.1 hypothetical protein BM613_09580 [Sulfoacidibacillus thermotolerans]